VGQARYKRLTIKLKKPGEKAYLPEMGKGAGITPRVNTEQGYKGAL